VDHDAAAGASQIWGFYTIPGEDSETPQTEGIESFNYSSALWPDSITDPGYSGTGTKDDTLQLGFSAAMGGADSTYGYRAVCNNASGCSDSAPSNDWDVYRYKANGTETLLTNKATTGSQYTDSQNDGGSAPNVRFTIDDAGTNYVKGDTYTFVAFKTSGDANAAKSLSFMQDADTFTVGSGETLELKGDELFDITGVAGGIEPRMELACRIHYANGRSEEIALDCRIDTLDEVEYYRHGGILQYVLRNLMAA